MSREQLLYYVSLYDENTLGHIYRVAKYACNIGNHLNLPKHEISLLLYASLLHDIGKVFIPVDLLQKKGKLSTDELDFLRQHVTIGLLIIPDSMHEVKQIIAAHHERLDGSGYPNQLADEQIPKLAKILAIADSYDAMTSNRVYNQIKTTEEAFDDLLSNTSCYGENKYSYTLVKSFIECAKK